ncbi:hypothetical protein Drorol1_Dr00002523 [Drosera rotundifolia]
MRDQSKKNQQKSKPKRFARLSPFPETGPVSPIEKSTQNASPLHSLLHPSTPLTRRRPLTRHQRKMEGDRVEVGPTEDTVRALIDLLVDPLLPAKVSVAENPPASQEEAVAKQMHSVVLLYNYYHRKWDPQLEFLEFDSFCKLSVIFKSSLLSYMKLMRGANYDDLDVLDKKLSMTEEKMMDACNIARSLDASKDVPVTEGRPVHKVAVFLVDSRGEKCLLQYSSITQGVWSLIEKEVDAPSQSSGNSSDSISGKRRLIRKPLKPNQTTDGAALQQIAFAAVTSVCGKGSTQSNISILEHHITYSLSKENAATCLYIMQLTQPVENIEMLSIADVMQSLKGPLLMRNECGLWISTPVVEYFHLLPYACILSDWLSRDPVPSTSQIFNTVVEAEKVNGSHENGEHREPIVYKKRNASHKSCSLVNDHVNQVVNSTEANSRSKDNAFAAGTLPDEMDVDESAIVISSIDDNKRSFPKENHAAELNKMIVPVNNGAPVQSNDAVPVPSSSLDKLQSPNEDGDTKNCSEKNVVRVVPSEQEKVHDQTVVAYASRSRKADKIQATIASKDSLLSQTALKVLFRKREMLSQQLRDIDDEIAVCNSNIQTILSGGENDLAVKIDSIIEGCNDVYFKNAAAIEERSSQYIECHGFPHDQKSKRNSDASFFFQNSCQELDGICNQSNWILPRYHISTTEGGFRAEVKVNDADFEHSSEGDVCSSPRAARESAAARILTRLPRLATSS